VSFLQRDSDGILHVVALSGGHDSTALSLLLREREPRPYAYVCTPTGDELPEMFAHWALLGERLGSRIIPVMEISLKGLIHKEGCLPNFRRRFCTRKIKIEPFRHWLTKQLAGGPVISYVGLRADEPGRAGGAYDQIPGVEIRYPLREWGFGEDEVQATLAERGIKCPDRTDCAMCYHQRLGEWWELWKNHPDRFDDAVAIEQRYGETFRTPGRDKWPSSLAEMGSRFEAGEVPTISLNRMKRERMASGSCRVCTL